MHGATSRWGCNGAVAAGLDAFIESTKEAAISEGRAADAAA